MEIKNSANCYYKDPKTLEAFTIDTPRIIPCKLSDTNKLTWPMVATSDGDIVKIAYLFFTDAEKILYKQYRGYDISKPLVHRQNINKVITNSSTNINTNTSTSTSTNTNIDNQYEVEDMTCKAVCLGTTQIINKCEKMLGAYFVAGINYALLTVQDSNKIYYIPYMLIDEEARMRLCNG